MYRVPDNTRKSLEKLAQLLDIPIEFGWQKKLAEWYGVKRNSVVSWIRHDSIPQKHIDAIARRGYPPDKWLITDDAPNATEAALMRLARVIGFGTDKRGWKTRVCEWLEINIDDMQKWIRRDRIPERALRDIDSRSYAREKWFYAPPPGEYKQAPEHIGVPTHDPRPGSYGIPDLSGHSVTQLYSPAVSNREYLAMVREILESDQIAVAEALRANVRQFHEQVKLTRRLRDLEQQINDLKEEVKKSKSPSPNHSPRGVAEGGNR